MALKFLGIAGSLRKKSTNKGLLRAVSANLPEDVTIEIADLSDIPFYNQDITEKPDSVKRVLAQYEKADAFVFAVPENNYSIAPALKNSLDWASREPNNSLLAGKAVAIMGAGGGMGASRAQYHLRQVCVCVDLFPLNKPEIFVNAFTGAFDENGDLIDEKIIHLIALQMQKLSEWCKAIAPLRHK